MKVTFSKQSGKAKECPTMKKKTCILGIYPCIVAGNAKCECQEYNNHIKCLREFPVSPQLIEAWSKDPEGKVYDSEKGDFIEERFNDWDYPSHVRLTVNLIPQESGVEEAAEKSANDYLVRVGSHDRPDITKHDFKEGFKAGAAHTAEGEAVEVLEWVLKEHILPRDANWFDAGKHYSSADLYQLFKQSKAIKP